MKRVFALTLLCALPFGAAVAEDKAALTAEAKGIVQEFFGGLKGELQKAMKEGGPVNAIQVCNQVAPAMAAAQSEKHGWQVGRTSLKLRNQANAPDAWERAVLEKFEERRAAGEDPAQMAFAEIVEEDGKKAFRFMKAIGMPPADKMPCLKCHGEQIAEPIGAKLDALYPEDQARGYKPGQIRGAFTLKKLL